MLCFTFSNMGSLSNQIRNRNGMGTKRQQTYAVKTRLNVTRTSYLMWKNKARYLSTLIAVNVRADAAAKNIPTPSAIIHPTLSAIGAHVICPNFKTEKNGCTRSPTPRSVRANPHSRMEDGWRKEGVFQNAASIKAFARTVGNAKIELKTQAAIVMWL